MENSLGLHFKDEMRFVIAFGFCFCTFNFRVTRVHRCFVMLSMTEHIDILVLSSKEIFFRDCISILVL